MISKIFQISNRKLPSTLRKLTFSQNYELHTFILKALISNVIYNHANDRDLCVCFLLSQICLVNFLIDHYPKIFGEDISFHCWSSLFCSDGENSLGQFPEHSNWQYWDGRNKKHEDNPCSSGNICPTGIQCPDPITSLHNEGVILKYSCSIILT